MRKRRSRGSNYPDTDRVESSVAANHEEMIAVLREMVEEMPPSSVRDAVVEIVRRWDSDGLD